MPTVGQPQIFNLPDDTAAYQSLGQGGGQLLAALLNLYRRQGASGRYTAPTGATTQISPAERTAGGVPLAQLLTQQASMGQGEFRPDRLPFLGQVPVSPQALPRLQLQAARGEVAKLPFELRKLGAEASREEAIAASIKGTSSGSEGKIVSLDDATGQEVPHGAPGSRKFRKKLTSTGFDYLPLTETSADRKESERQSKAADLLEDTKLIMEDVDTLFGYLDDVPSGRMAGAGVKMETFFGTDTPAALGLRDYESEKDLFLAKISKVLGGEVGVLTDRDIERIAAAFPKYWMTADERSRRITRVKAYIQRRVDAFTRRSGQAGTPATSSTPSSSNGADPLGLR